MLPCSLLETAGCKEGVGSIASERRGGAGGVSGSRGQQSEQEKVQEDKGRRDKDAICKLQKQVCAMLSFLLFAAGEISPRRQQGEAQLVCGKSAKKYGRHVLFRVHFFVCKKKKKTH